MNLKKFNKEHGIAIIVQCSLGDDIGAAIKQGRNFAEAGILPAVIFTGVGESERVERAVESAGVSEGIKQAFGIPVQTLNLPAISNRITYNIDQLGHYESTEPESVFEARIMAGVFGEYPYESTILFLLDLAATSLVYNARVIKGDWSPKRGGGIVFSQGFNIAREFLPDLTVVENE